MTTTETVLAEIAQILRDAGEHFHGGEPDELAAEWVGAIAAPTRTIPRIVAAWVDAGCWAPEAAADLRAIGAGPGDLSRDLVYAVANGDVTAYGAVTLAHELRRAYVALHRTLSAGCISDDAAEALSEALRDVSQCYPEIIGRRPGDDQPTMAHL